MSALTWAQAVEAWIAAGGNPQAAAMAAAVASSSSGLNPDASAVASDGSGIHGVGLWQIPSTLGALATTDPVANARAAIQLSSNGTDWSKWKTAYSDNIGGAGGGTYLGDGSNAVAALQANGGTFQVVGAAGVAGITTISPSHNSTSEQTATAASDPGSTAPGAAATATTTGFKSRTVILILLLAVGIVVYVMVRHKKGSSSPVVKPVEPRASG